MFLLLTDDFNPSDLSSLSDSLTLDDGKGLSVPIFTPPSKFTHHTLGLFHFYFFSHPDDELGSQRQRSRSIQYSPRLNHVETLDIHYNKDRRVSVSEQHADNRYTVSTDSGAY